MSDEIEEGFYDFRVDSVEQKTFSTGNRGVSLQLLAQVNEREIRVYDNVPALPSVKWKRDALLTSVGLDPESKVDIDDLVGKQGRARFVKNDRGYLSVKSYVKPRDKKPEAQQPPAGHTWDADDAWAAGVETPKAQPAQQAKPAPYSSTSDDVPF